MTKIVCNMERQWVRPNECLGGGHFVFRRNEKRGRIFPSRIPFEHEDSASAHAEAVRLAELHPGVTFEVMAVVTSISSRPDVIDNGPGDIAEQLS